VIRLIQAGAGFWGRSWASEILPAVPEVTTVAHVDPDPAALAALQAAAGVPPERCFASLPAALAAVEADAVLGSLALPAHLPVGRAALEAGLHYIVEKPFAPDLAGGAALVALARRRGRVLMVSQNYRFYPAAIAAAALVRSGRLGRPLSVAIDFRRHAPSEGHRYLGIPDPLLADMSIHHFDLLRFVLGREPVAVACRAWNPAGSPFANEASAFATIELEGGVMASYRGSWVSAAPRTPWAGLWQIEFEGGAAEWTAKGEKAARLAFDRLAVRPLGGDWQVEPLPPLPLHDRAGALAAFARRIAGESPPGFSSGADNLGTLALTEAAIRSAAAGGAPVAVAPLLDSVRPILQEVPA
jgi:predicted dehydrogenase